ncbi:MAG: hypothetical protein ACTSQG_08920, partial [Promethearchaeota archaeon]
MDDNNEQEKSIGDYNEEEFDPTKEAFFSDLLEMEDEISNEAYELVEHALSLLASNYYDDAIEILKQAIGLYEQINSMEEVEAINQKIAEIYLIKEQQFTETREEEEQAEIIPEEEEIVEELQKIIEEGETREQLPDYTVEQLIEEANQLVEIEEFDEALERYNEGLKIYISLNDVNKIEEVKSLIEKCEIAKSEFLQKVPKEKVISDVIKQEEEILREKEIQEQRVKEFEERKKKEKQISEQAYDFMEQGSEFIKNKQFTEGIEFYEKAVNLFSEINWVNDVQKINAIISKLRKEKEIFEKEIEKDKEKKLEEFRKKVEHEALLREKKEEQKRQEEIARL